MNRKIVGKDGRTISLHPDGQIWVSEEGDRSFSSPAFVVHGYCNTYKLYGVEAKYEKKYYPVHPEILKYARKFRIKFLRVHEQYIEDGRKGPIHKVRYGYVPRKKFEYLRKHRKTVLRFGQRKVLLLKQTDMKWQEE